MRRYGRAFRWALILIMCFMMTADLAFARCRRGRKIRLFRRRRCCVQQYVPAQKSPVQKSPIQNPIQAPVPVPDDVEAALDDAPPPTDTEEAPAKPGDVAAEAPNGSSEEPEKFEEKSPAEPVVKTAEEPKTKEKPAEPADAKPVAKKKKAAPADDLDDLFDEPEKKEEKPAKKEKKAAPADDLDDLFGEPEKKEEKPAPKAEKKAPADDADDLFGDPEPAKKEIKKKAKPADDEDDLFNALPNGAQPVGFKAARDVVRTWTDDTGEYTCRGRLVWSDDGQVRILKENGRPTTLPLSRLSEADRQFIEAAAARESVDDKFTWLRF